MKFERTWTGNWENAFHGLRHPMESYSRSDSEFGLVQPYGDEDLNVTTEWLIKDYPELEEGTSEWVDRSIERSDWIVKNGVIKYDKSNDTCEYVFIGPNDMDLAQRMIKAGTPNDKFLRQIFVSVDITGPLYWWKELDTYKIGTTANSTSTMHKLATTPITLDCFETDDMDLSIPVGAWSMSTEKEYTPEPNYNSSEVISHIIQDIDEKTNKVISEHNFYYSKEDLERLKNIPLESDVYGILNSLERLRLKYLETKDIRYWKELIRWLPESWLQTRTWTANYAVLRQIYHWRKNHKLTEWHQFCDFVLTLPYANELIAYNN